MDRWSSVTMHCVWSLFFAFVTILNYGIYIEVTSAQQLTPDPFRSLSSIPELSEIRDYFNSCIGASCDKSVSITIPSKSGQVTLELIKHEIRSTDLIVDLVNAEPRVTLFRGEILGGNPSDFARFSLIDKVGEITFSGFMRISGIFYRIGQPSKDNITELETREIAGEEFERLIGFCDVASKLSSTRNSPKTEAITAQGRLYIAEIATEADNNLVQYFGSAAVANAEILSILNAVDGIYRADLGITLRVVYQHNWSAAVNPYLSSDSEKLLSAFRTYWETYIRPNHPYDVAHLWVGQEMDSYVAGIAYLGSMCTDYSYGLSTFYNDMASDVVVTAHEIGHNFGASHDSLSSPASYIMYPSVVASAKHFSPDSKAEIASAVTQYSCLESSGSGGGGTTNHAPVLSYIGPRTVAEGSTLQIALSATDIDGNSLRFFSDNLPAGASISNRTFIYSPSYDVVRSGNESRAFNVIINVSDGKGKADSETVTITVTNTNRPPNVTSVASSSGQEGLLTSVSLSASDPDGENLTFNALDSLPPGLSLDSSSGKIAWKPGGDQAGVYSFRVSVSDIWSASKMVMVTIQVSDRTGVSALPQVWRRGDYQGTGTPAFAVYRPATGTWLVKHGIKGKVATKQFGLAGDVPLIADFNGDRITDYALFRPSNGYWYITYSGSGASAVIPFGQPGDLPVVGDFDGDGRSDFATFRPAQGRFYYRPSADLRTTLSVAVGAVGDIPLVGDDDGDGRDDFAVFRNSSATWYIRTASGQTYQKHYGEPGDIPIISYFKSSAHADIGLWRGTKAQWLLAGDTKPVYLGKGQDAPMALDIDRDGMSELVVWRPESGTWYWRRDDGSVGSQQLGLSNDLAVYSASLYYAMRNLYPNSSKFNRGLYTNVLLLDSPKNLLLNQNGTSLGYSSINARSGDYIAQGDFDGDGLVDYVAYSAGTWNTVLAAGGSVVKYWGASGDIPVVADYDGDGKVDYVVYRPNDHDGFSRFYNLRSSDGLGTAIDLGLAGDIPMVGDYDGDGWADYAVWRESNGMWYVKSSRTQSMVASKQWGLPGDVPLGTDLDRDGRVDFIVWRPSNGIWYSSLSGGGMKAVQWGLSGDIALGLDYFGEGVGSYTIFRPSGQTLYSLSSTGIYQSIPLPGILSEDRITAVGIRPWGRVN